MNVCPWVASNGSCPIPQRRQQIEDQDEQDDDVLDWKSDSSTIVAISPKSSEPGLHTLKTDMDQRSSSYGATYLRLPTVGYCFDSTEDRTVVGSKYMFQLGGNGTSKVTKPRNQITKAFDTPFCNSLPPIDEDIQDEEDELETTEIDSPWSSLYSADTPIMDEHHHLTPFKKDFLDVVMLAFKQFQKASPGETNEHYDGQPSSPTGSNNRSRGESNSNNSGKRPWSSSGSNTGSGGTTASGRSSKRRSVDRRFTFACPFAKKDPFRYRECYHKILTRIRDVKQHITRCHCLPVYCPRCMDTFDDESARDIHIRSVSCQERPFAQFEGCSQSQRDQLSHRVSQKLPQEKQWYTVFDILFPGHPHPSSPLVDREIFEPIAAFRDYVTDKGPTLMLEFFKSKGVNLDCQPQEERDLLSFQQTIIREGLEIILDTALSGQSSCNDGSGSVDSQASALQPPASGAPVKAVSEFANDMDEARTSQYPVPATQGDSVESQSMVHGDIWSNKTGDLQGGGAGSLFDMTIAEETRLDEQRGDYMGILSDSDFGGMMLNFTQSDFNGVLDSNASAEWSLYGELGAGKEDDT